MNILIFNWRDIKHPEAGGSELYFHEISRRWAADGNKVTWICGGWKNCLKEETIDGINIIRTGRKFTLYFSAPFVYSRLKEKPDIIIDVENGIPFFTPLFTKEKKMLHIHHIHDSIWFMEMPFPFSLIGWLLEMKLMPLIYKNVRVSTISQSSAKEIEKKGYNLIGTVNPGINKSLCCATAEKTKYPSILFVNRIKKYKGLNVLVKAFQKADIDYSKLFIAGRGDYPRQKDNRIKVLGMINEREKHALMESCWMFISPGFKEGWGIANIEAASHGTPVIGSDVPGIRDSVINGFTGMLFKYGDADMLAEKMLLLSSNDKLRKRLGKNARIWASHFSWDKTAKEYMKILCSL